MVCMNRIACWHWAFPGCVVPYQQDDCDCRSALGDFTACVGPTVLCGLLLSKSQVRVLQLHAAKPGLKQSQAFVCTFSTTDFLRLTILEGKLPSPCTPTLAVEMRDMNEQYLLPCFCCGSKGATMTVSETCENSLQSSGYAGCRIH